MNDRRLFPIAFVLGLLMAWPPGSPAGEIGPYGQQALDALAEAIEQGDPDLFFDRVLEVEDLDCRQHAVPLLIEALDHEDRRIRQMAIYRLRDLAPLAEEAMPALIAQLPDPYLGFQAGCTLTVIGREAVPGVVEALKSPSEDARAEAYRVLTNMGPPAEAAVPALIEALEDLTPEVRASAAYTLAGIGPRGRAALPALKRRLSDEDEQVQSSARFAIGALDPETVSCASTVDELVDANVSDYGRDAFLARKALSRLGPEGLALLLEGLKSEDPDQRVLYVHALTTLRTRKKEALAGVVPLLEDPSPRVRCLAAMAVCSLTDEGASAASNSAADRAAVDRAISVLVEALGDPEPEIRENAAFGLALFGPAAKAAVPALLEAAHDKQTETAAATALAMIGPEARQLVPEMIHRVRRQREGSGDACFALLLIGRPAVPALTQLLSHEVEGARETAALLLGELGPQAAEAVPALIRALDDLSGSVQVEAAAALESIGPAAAPAIPALIAYCDRENRDAAPDDYMVRACVDPLWDLGPKAKAIVAQRLREHLPAIRADLEPPVGREAREAVGALSVCAPPAEVAVPLLKEALSSEDICIRLTAAMGLWKITGRHGEALPVLERGLRDPVENVRAVAIHCLGELGPAAQPAVPAIVRGLSEWPARARLAGVETLRKIAPEHEAILRALAELIADQPEVRICRDALEIAVEMGPAARPLLPIMKRFWSTISEQTLLLALRRIRPPEESGEPAPPVPEETPGVVSPALEEAIREVVQWVAEDREGHFKYMIDTLRGFCQTHPGESAARSLAQALLAAAVPDEGADADDTDTRRWLLAAALRRLGDPVQPVILDAVDHEDEHVRACAIQSVIVREEDVDRLVPSVVAWLEDPEPLVRRYAAGKAKVILLLDAGKAGQLAPLLVEGLREELCGREFDALCALGPAAETAAPGLRKLLEDQDGATRIRAAYVLWRVTGDRKLTVDVLIEALRSEDAELRQSAFWHLQWMRAEAADAVPTLVKMLQQREVERAQMRELGQTDIDLARIVDTLERIGPAAAPAVPALLRIAADADERTSTREDAVDALAAIGVTNQGVVPALVDLLHDADDAVRRNAAEALGKVAAAPDIVVPALVEAAEEDDWHILSTAIEALERFGPKAEAAVPFLTKVVEARERDSHRAAMALWRITGDPAPALSVIPDDLDDPSPYLREGACERLAEIGPAAAEAVPGVKANLTHESHEVRIAAAEAVWKITGDAEPAVPVLVDLLDEEYLPPLPGWSVRSSVSDRVKVIELLGQMGPAARAALPELRKLTEHESFRLRRAAASAIEKLTAGSPGRSAQEGERSSSGRVE